MCRTFAFLMIFLLLFAVQVGSASEMGNATLHDLSSQKVPPSIEALQAAYEHGKSKLHTSDADEINKTELLYLAYGLDFIDFSSNNYNISLTLSEEDVFHIETIASAAHEAYVSGALSQENLLSFSKIFAGYLGLLITHHKGGTWVPEVKGMEDSGPAIQKDAGEYYFVLSKVFRRLQNGSEDNLVHFYQIIPYDPPVE